MDHEKVTMDEAALTAALRLQNDNPEWKGKSIRLYIEGKGCDGFYYGVCFDKPLPDDVHFIQKPTSDIHVVVDTETLEYVKGSSITWSKFEEKEGFLVTNPFHRKFRGKFFKTSAWKKKLEEKQQASH